jgi:SAM-dependent methyltransferase
MHSPLEMWSATGQCSGEDGFVQASRLRSFLAKEVHRELMNSHNTGGARRTLLISKDRDNQANSACYRMIIFDLEITASPTHEFAGKIETLPLIDGCVDLIACIGGFVNFHDVALVLSECSRVIRPGGTMLLGFESSYGADFKRLSAFGRPITTIDMYCIDMEQTKWVYSFKYIKNLLRAAGFRILQISSIQLFSYWALLLTQNPLFLTLMGRLDLRVKSVRALTRWAPNQFLVCQKSA